MLIYFLRHGEAVTTGDDWSRTLTTEGANRIRAEAAVLKALDVRPDAIFTSPLPRAVQTAEIVAEILSPDRSVQTREELAPGASLGDLQHVLSGLEGDGSVLVVGHEPDLSSIVAALIASGSARIELKKGGLALVESDVPVGPGSGKLRWLVEPALLLTT